MIVLTPEQRLTVESKFRDLANQWGELAAYSSNMGALRRHPLFDEIVALGEPAIPLILRELERKPSASWFGLLAAIAGENPVPPELAGQSEGSAVLLARSLLAAAQARRRIAFIVQQGPRKTGVCDRTGGLRGALCGSPITSTRISVSEENEFRGASKCLSLLSKQSG